MKGDDERLEEAQRRERNAKIEKLERYRPALMNYMKRCGFSFEEAQDLTQDVLLRVSENVDTYRSEAAFGYLTTIAKRVVFNFIRDRHAQKRSAKEEPIDDAVAVADTHNVPADEMLHRNERSKQLREAVAQLGLPLRACVVLYLEGKSYEEIAKELRLTVSAVKSRLNAARHRLRELMGVDVPGLGGE